jgi:acetyl-CoA C-acetyltransferase
MTLSDAYIYDAVRTPRGKGREGGALSEIGPHELVAQLVAALKDRTSPDAVDSACAATSRWSAACTRACPMRWRPGR